MTAPDRTVDEALYVLGCFLRTHEFVADPDIGEAQNALATVRAELERMRGIVQGHISWSHRREGMVVAYGYDGRYVGCLGQETWQWLLDHSEIGARELDDLLAANERLRDEVRSRDESIRIIVAEHGRHVVRLRDERKAAEAEIERLRVRCAFPACVEGEKPGWCGRCGDACRAEAAEARVRELESGLREIRNVLGPDHFSGELDGLIVEGEEALRIALALLDGNETACQHPTLDFDRTVCACGWMHTYCADCGAQIDACQEGTAA